MKKVKEMNGIEKIAYRNIKAVFDWEIGGWYNCLEDEYPEEIPDTMNDAKEIIYNESLNDGAGPGWFQTGKAPKEMRFAGKEFIMSVIDYLFKTDGDALVVAEAKWEVDENE